ncbi:hypothetical protein H4R34_004344 [Dimargaris verticillata]|uniref:Major facilitator superfamily domain-containing protein n=1 Tax=Dimargaris verticillata TaxID=2761393 RepID=A0A9W8E7C1_9FUNG|nr:hypothetical protein H4R34_004344 [Dimargaris verticillata]
MTGGTGRRSSVRISWFHTTSDSIATLPDPPPDASPASRTTTGYLAYNTQPATAAAIHTGHHVFHPGSYSTSVGLEPYEEYVVSRHFRDPPPPIGNGHSLKPSQRKCHVNFARPPTGHHSNSQPLITAHGHQSQQRSWRYYFVLVGLLLPTVWVGFSRTVFLLLPPARSSGPSDTTPLTLPTRQDIWYTLTYELVYMIFLLILGPLSQRLGSVLVTYCSLLIYLVGSVVGGLFVSNPDNASEMSLLVLVARVLGAVGGAGLTNNCFLWLLKWPRNSVGPSSLSSFSSSPPPLLKPPPQLPVSATEAQAAPPPSSALTPSPRPRSLLSSASSVSTLSHATPTLAPAWTQPITTNAALAPTLASGTTHWAHDHKTIDAPNNNNTKEPAWHHATTTLTHHRLVLQPKQPNYLYQCGVLMGILWAGQLSCSVLGPLVGEYWINHWGWSWAFMSNTIVGAVTLGLHVLSQGMSWNADEDEFLISHLDGTGIGLLCAGWLCLLLGCCWALEAMPSFSLQVVLTLLVFAGAFFVLFGLWNRRQNRLSQQQQLDQEQSQQQPQQQWALIPWRAVWHRNVGLCLVALMIVGLIFTGTVACIHRTLKWHHSFGWLQAFIWSLPLAIATCLGALATGCVIRRTRFYRIPLWMAAVCLITGTALLLVWGHHDPYDPPRNTPDCGQVLWIPATILIGLGIGSILPTLMVVGQHAVAELGYALTVTPLLLAALSVGNLLGMLVQHYLVLTTQRHHPYAFMIEPSVYRDRIRYFNTHGGKSPATLNPSRPVVLDATSMTAWAYGAAVPSIFTVMVVCSAVLLLLMLGLRGFRLAGSMHG